MSVTPANVNVETKIPGIPSVTGLPDNLKAILGPIKEIMDLRNGVNGDPLDKAVTLRDLYNAGSISLFLRGRSMTNSPPATSTYRSAGAALDFTPPAAITGLAATGAMASIFLEWDAPDSYNYSFVEVWQSATNDLGVAVKVGTAIPNVYADFIGTTGATRYYWVRAMSAAGVEGPFNAVSGVSAATGLVGGVDLTDNIITSQKIAAGAIDAYGQFGSGLRPPEIGAALPTLPDTDYPAGSLFVLNTDSKLYRVNPAGTSWTTAVPATDMSGAVDFSTQVGGAAKPSDNATVGATWGVNVVSIPANVSTAGASPGTSLLNSGISINASGSLTGAGGGSVTIGGLGYTGALNATTNTMYNQALDPGGVNGDTWYDTSTAIFKIKVAGAWVQVGTIGATWSGSLTGIPANISTAGASPGTSILNSAISINAAGTLSGAGSGSVTIAGLGYTGSLSATANTMYNQALDPGGVNGDTWYDTTAAALKIKVSGAWVTVGDITSGKTAAAISGQGSFATVSQITLANAPTLIAAVAINADRIVANSITAGQIAAATITGDRLVANTITAAQIAANTITAAQITASTITAAEIAAATITGDRLVANTITAAQIAAGTITAAQIGAASITGDRLVANTITAGQIAANTITSGQIAANTITAAQIAAGTVTATQMATGTITAGSGIIANAAITNALIATLAADKLTAGTITAAVGLTAATITGGSLDINGLFIVSTLGAVTIKSATTGARLEIVNDVIRVYDSSGTLRVKLGNLA